MNWSIGVEFELLAPIGLSRKDLAHKIALNHGGEVRSFWHPQVEPSLVPGMKIFHNLTPGFRVYDRSGHLIALCVGDLTINKNLDRNSPSQKNWSRILSDDIRILHLIARHAGPVSTSLGNILEPISALFGTQLYSEGEMARVEGYYHQPVALGSGLPGERERVTELVSGILTTDHADQLERLLRPAQELGYTLAIESATHIHFDGEALKTPKIFANVAELLNRYRLVLRYLFQTNRHCVRLGPWSAEFLLCIRKEEFRNLTWDEAKTLIRGVGLTKFCDFNLRNIIYDVPDKNTIEIRILPGLIKTEPVLIAAEIIELILRKAMASKWINASTVLGADKVSLQQMFKEIGWSNPSPQSLYNAP
jgi:hypothetical protein